MNHINNIRMQDLEHERKRRVRGFLAGAALTLLLWVIIIVSVRTLL